jgi:molybdenum cofactor cytidylyltransferase
MLTFTSITPIILAAGDSSRMGYPKALLPLGGHTFLMHILKTVQEIGLSNPVVILGKAADLIQPGILDWPALVRTNPDPDKGQLSSIQLGLSNLPSSAQAAMIWPVDQPAVSEDLIRNLARLFIQSEPMIAYPKYGDKRGHPAIFHRALFREFIAIPPGESPKSILLRHQQDTAELPTIEQATVQDIDTPEDYEAIMGESVRSALERMKTITN